MGEPPVLPPLMPAVAGRRATRDDEVVDLVELLIEHADPSAGSPAQIARVAEKVAVACLGDNHLWQDLRLPSRRELSALMSHWFPALAARNDRDMKWKKFLYKQLCDRAGLFICRAPTCAECGDHARCFGPEDAATA